MWYIKAFCNKKIRLKFDFNSKQITIPGYKLKQFYQYLPKRIKKCLSVTKLFIKSPSLSLRVKKQYQCSSPIYLLSFPRSGSSWVGSIIGHGKYTRYLREPITTAFYYHKSMSASVFSKNKCEDWPLYYSLLKKASSTELTFLNSALPEPTQWTNNNVKLPIIIKEVNPLIIEELAQLDIKLVYLTRHPFSIAKSYEALGWDKPNQFETRFTDNEISNLLTLEPDLVKQDFFYQIGFLQGFIEKKFHELALGEAIVYEELLASPLNQFKRIFDTLDLKFSSEVEFNLMTSISGKEQSQAGQFDLVRNIESIKRISIKPELLSSYNSTMAGYCSALKGMEKKAIYSNNKYVEFD